MHPLLFIDFAMWLNPAFKVKVLKFVYDQLIQYRNDAGDTYKEMAAQIASDSFCFMDSLPSRMLFLASSGNKSTTFANFSALFTVFLPIPYSSAIL